MFVAHLQELVAHKGSLIATHVKFTDKSVSFQVILGNLKLWMTIELAKL